MTRKIDIIRLPGLTPYRDALLMQQQRRAEVEQGATPHALYLLQHAPVMTLGRKFHQENLLRAPEELRALNIDVCETDRGGDVTYHGPGQLVAYPILNLNAWQLSIQWYLRALEDVLIAQLARYGIHAGRIDGLTGVWVDGAKIAAIGIGIHHWTTFHGIALNVNPDLSHFQYIIPCGIADKPVTSLAKVSKQPPTMEQAMTDFEEEFLKKFGTAN